MAITNDIDNSLKELGDIKKDVDMFSAFDSISLEDDLNDLIMGLGDIDENVEYQALKVDESILVKEPEVVDDFDIVERSDIPKVIEVVESVISDVEEEKVEEEIVIEEIPKEEVDEINIDVTVRDIPEEITFEYTTSPNLKSVDDNVLEEKEEHVEKSNEVAIIEKQSKKKRNRKTKDEIEQERKALELAKEIMENGAESVIKENTDIAIRHDEVNLNITPENAMDGVVGALKKFSDAGITIHIGTLNINIGG